MPNKKEQSVDSIIAAATGKMSVKTPPTGAPIDNGQQFDFDQPAITGPLDFSQMKPVAVNEKNIVPLFSKSEVASAVKNIDSDYGKAFQIAVKTVEIFKVENVKDFIKLVEKVKESL
jgi:hypothetical protein